MPDKPVKVIIDTNLWISFLISGSFSRLDPLLFSKKLVLIFSEELIEEFVRVASIPKFSNFFSQNDIDAVLRAISDDAEFVTVQTRVNICRDPKDDFLLGLALDSQADVLVTGDADLLDLVHFGKTKMMTMISFLHVFEKHG